MKRELVRTRAPATVGQYETALRHWEGFVRHATAAPTTEVESRSIPTTPAHQNVRDDVHAITDGVLAAFRDWLESSEDLSDSTITKTWSFMRSILYRLGPRIPSNPRGLGIVATFPFLATEPQRAGKKRILTAEELAAIYRACSSAVWPDDGGVQPSIRWRALVALFYTYGPRTQDLLQLPWSAVKNDRSCPDEEITLTNDLGWLSFVPEKTKRTKPGPLIFPLNAVARLHLDALRTERRLVFDFPKSDHSLYKQWRAILEAAEIRRCHLKDLRKTCSTAYNRIQKGLGDWMLGHAPRGTNQTFYIGADEDILRAVHQLPYPPAISGATFERQRLLWS